MPLIHVGPAFEAFVLAFLAAYAVVFLVVKPETRAYLFGVTLFTSSLRTDVGIAWDAVRVTSMLAWILMVVDTSLVTKRFHHLIGKKLFVILAFAVAVSFFGAYYAPQLRQSTTFIRSQEMRSVTAWVTMLLNVSVVWVVYKGLRTRESIQRFFGWILLAAVVSVAIAVIQEITYLMGRPILGLLREGDDILPYVSLAGIKFLRVSALSTEPKGFGMAMVLLVALLAGLGTSYQNCWYYKCRTYLTYLFLGCMFVSFSSGAFLAFLVLIVGAWGTVGSELKKISGLTVVAIISICLAFPNIATNLYEERVVRIYQKVESGYNVSKGTRKAIQESDDKEAAAMAYLLQRPTSGILGLGFGNCPYYYNHLVHPRWRHVFAEPNSGITYMLLSIGVVGIILFLYLFHRILRGKYVPAEDRKLIRTLGLSIAAMWIPLHGFEWVSILIALGATDAWQISELNVVKPHNQIAMRTVYAEPERQLTAAY